MIFDAEDRVLLCHRRDHDVWNLPGGGLESGETPWDAVKREVREETGLDVKISKLTGVYSKQDKDELVFSFICTVIGGEITLNLEADRIEYFGIDKLPTNTIPKQVERINDAVRSPDSIFLKVQTGKSSVERIKEGEL